MVFTAYRGESHITTVALSSRAELSYCGSSLQGCPTLSIAWFPNNSGYLCSSTTGTHSSKIVVWQNTTTQHSTIASPSTGSCTHLAPVYQSTFMFWCNYLFQKLVLSTGLHYGIISHTLLYFYLSLFGSALLHVLIYSLFVIAIPSLDLALPPSL